MKTLALTWLLLPCALRGQEGQEKNQAEELFNQLEARLSRAETIRCKYKAAMEGLKDKPEEKEPYKLEGVLLLQKGNRMRLEMDGVIQDPAKGVVVSDGTTMQAEEAGKGKPQKRRTRENTPSRSTPFPE